MQKLQINLISYICGEIGGSMWVRVGQFTTSLDPRGATVLDSCPNTTVGRDIFRWNYVLCKASWESTAALRPTAVLYSKSNWVAPPGSREKCHDPPQGGSDTFEKIAFLSNEKKSFAPETSV